MIIDVSEHQGKIDWEKVKPQIEGAIIRCGYGSDLKSQDDKYWERNVSECERLNIPFGVYIYSYAKTIEQAKSEAKHVKRLVEGLKLAFPIFYDLEEAKYASAAKLMGETWLAEMKGYETGIYASLSWFNSYLKGLDCKKWVAAWRKTQPKIENIILWQYSSTEKLAGISGNVDANKNIAMKIIESEPVEKPVESKPVEDSEEDVKMPTLRQGSTGKAVKVWQVIIGVTIDGKFGPKTLNATRTFQANNGLNVDGIVGPKTWKKGLESV